jgi:hypothetical protein
VSNLTEELRYEIRDMIKEMFRDGTIKIEHEVKSYWEYKEFKTKVIIDGDIVYQTDVELI